MHLHELLDGATLVLYTQVFLKISGQILSMQLTILLFVTLRGIGVDLSEGFFIFIFKFRYTYRLGHMLSDGSYIWSKLYSFRASPYPGQNSLQRIIIFGDMGKVY